MRSFVLRFVFCLAATLAAPMFFTLRAAAAVDTPREREAPFVAGQGGYAIYRIPAMAVTGDGVLLAFAEGRTSMGDQAHNRIVLRRSIDGGKTWDPLQIVADDGLNSLNNPTVVVLRGSGRILLMYQRYSSKRREGTVKTGVTGNDTCLSFITSSEDGGKTWAPPRDITPQVKRPTVATSVASGPGVGIELERGAHAGRIIFPFNQGPPGHWQLYAAYSDDGGTSWKYGDLAPAGADGRGNEVQMVELSDGRVMLNSRASSGKRFRKVAISSDGGATWSQLHNDLALPDSECQGSIIRYDEPTAGSKGIILFANPAVQKGRTHGTIRMSEDDGNTWSASRELVPGDFAYCCLAVLPDHSILCLYETDGYKKIALSAFTIDWLRAGTGEKQP